MEISEIFPRDGHIQDLYCDMCEGYLDLTFRLFDEHVSGVHIRIDGLPYLSCIQCDKHYLPDDSRFAIICCHKQALKNGQDSFNSRRNKTNEDYGYTTVSFKYDSDDYKYIPGLMRPHNSGFLTPVFFNKEVLLKCDASPTYRLSFCSTTYGEIRQGEDFAISFGLNKNGKVIMWLGDIAKLPQNEQLYLCSQNVESDHSIGSEFYDGQIEVNFTERTKENLLFNKRSDFLEEFFKHFGKKVARLEEEVYDLAINFNQPVIDTDKERHHVTDTLNKIYLESFDNNALGKVLKGLSIDPKSLGSIKRLQLVMETFESSDVIYQLMCPFYVLYDLRVDYSHVGSKEGNEKTLRSVKKKDLESHQMLNFLKFTMR